MPYTALNEANAEAAFTTTEGAPLTSVGETLQSFLDELEPELGNRDDVDPTRMTKWINWAYRNVAAMVDVKELDGSQTVELLADQPLYLVPIQVASAQVLSIVDETEVNWEGREMNMIDLDTYRKLPAVDATRPTDWFRWRRMLVVYPTPDIAYTASLEFKVRPDDLVDATDSPLLTPEFHEAILLSARHRAWRSLMQYSQAMQAMNDFLTCIRPLQDNAAKERENMPSGTFPARTQADLYRRRQR